MATTKPTKPAAKAAPKAAAPAPAVQEVDQTVDVGSLVRFNGYGEDVPAEERYLTEGETYEIVGFTEADPESDPPYEGGDPILAMPNPEFNAKKKEHPETNAKFLQVQALLDELEVVAAEEEAPAEEVAAPAPAPAVKKAAAKTAAPAAKTAAPAKAAAKTAAKKTAAPAKKVAAPKAEEPAEPVDPLAVPELAQEDPDVLELVAGSQDLIATAQELDAQVASSEFHLGGVLYHVKKDKLHLQIVAEDGKTALYTPDKAGWEKFLEDHFNIDYRKAQWLLEIYVNFSQAGITDAASQVARMGWTKAKTIAKKLNEEGVNCDELIELAMESTVKDLSEAIKSSEVVGATGGTRVSKITLKFKFKDEDGATVNGILGAAQEQFALKTIDEALLHIVTEWAQANANGTATAAKAPAQRTAAKGPAATKPAAKAAPARRVAAAA